MKHRRSSLILLLLLAMPPMGALAAEPPPAISTSAVPGSPPMVMPAMEGTVTASTATAPRSPTATASSPVATVSVPLARVRDLPNINGGSTVLELLAEGQTVQLSTQLADHAWYGVMTPAGGHGWMHVSVIRFDPQVLQTLPVATGDLRALAMPMTRPLPAATAAARGMTGLTDAEIVPLPPAAGPRAPTAGPTVPVDLTLQVCFDQNGSHSCDEGDGVQNVIVQVSDTGTTELLKEGLTDQRGVLHLQLEVAVGTALRVAVPALPVVQTVTVAAPRPGEPQRAPLTLAPILLPAATMPWPLP